MRHTASAGVCPAPWCSLVVFHTCGHRETCRGDAGLLMAQHVAAVHPELVYTPNEIARRQLKAQMARRAN